MGKDERVTVDHIAIDGDGYGRVVLSNGMELGKVLGFDFEVTAGRPAELVHAVTVQVVHHPLEREGGVESLAGPAV